MVSSWECFINRHCVVAVGALWVSSAYVRRNGKWVLPAAMSKRNVSFGAALGIVVVLIALAALTAMLAP
jgi:hypothetical protein